MKTNHEDNARSEHAQNEKRDSQGRFESDKTKNDMNHSNKSDHQHGNNNQRGSHSETAQNEKRDSHGRFESDNNK